MAIASNNSTDEVVNSVKYWQGVGSFRVIAVNPTKEECESFGIQLKQEPKYTGITLSEGVVRNKVVFFVENKENSIITRVEFLVAPEERVARTGSFMIINKFGQHTWAASVEAIQGNPNMNWFKTDAESGVRKAYVGEAEIIDFLIPWANVASKGEVSLDTIDQIVKGNVTELKQLQRAISDNEVQLLLGVKVTEDGKTYQNVYSKWYGRPYTKSYSALIKKLGEEYGEFKATYDPTDLGTLKQFTNNSMPSSPTVGATEEAEGDSPWKQ